MRNYSDFAKQILMGTSLEDKLIDDSVEWGEWKDFSLPYRPGRNQSFDFTDKQIKFPKSNRLKENEQKAIALHSFANHELLAIEMMAAALLLYPHQDEESLRFKKGILNSLKDEQKHFKLYVHRLNELDYGFGDFPLNDFFWRQMEKLKTPAQYAAVMALTFESANLDFAQYYSKVFTSLGDLETANILNIVLEDEIAHVAFGSFWMKKWRSDETLWEYYLKNLPWPMTPARSRGIEFDTSLHHKAINDQDFISQLAQFDDEFSVTKRGSIK